jgi:hypothetical protein
MRCLLLCLVGVWVLGWAEAIYTQNGDKQLNNVASIALSGLAARGELDTISRYFSPTSPPDPLAVKDVSLCRRPLPTEAEGTLAEVIQRGTLRICLKRGDMGNVSNGDSYGIAAQDYPVLGVDAGELYGTSIDWGKAIAEEVGLLLSTPLTAEFILCADSDDGFFDSIYKCLAARKCDMSLPELFRLPYREKLVDYTCSVSFADSNGVFSIKANGFENVNKICTVEGTGQEGVAKDTYPDATYVYASSLTEMWTFLCMSKCDYVVDSYNQGINSHLTIAACSQTTLYSFRLPPSSPGGDVGAVTLMSSYN